MTEQLSKAQRTRLELLKKAFDISYRKGFLQASLDEILAGTNVTKGAFYYHFRNKDEMGIALINELMRPAILSGFGNIAESGMGAIETIVSLNRFLLFENPDLLPEYGCPAGNFVHEMTPWNEPFREALFGLVSEWRSGLIGILENGKTSGELSADLDPEALCTYIMSAYWGVRELAKLNNDSTVYNQFLEQLRTHLEKFRS